MASFTERVTILIETKVTSAKSQLNGLKKSIAETEGATGKLKVAVGGVGKAVNSAVGSIVSPAGLAATGAAIAGLAAKSVKAFEELGLTVGKFSDATGIAAEDSSRLVEVVTDLGIAPDQAQAAIGRMSKAIGANSDAFSKYGIEAVKAANGTVDVLATFENAVRVISQIRDPTQQAAAANAVFGKSWQSMAELIKGGLPALQSAMAAVQDSKIAGPDDVRSARELRAALDEISDAADGLLLTLGKSLAPALADLAPKIADLATKAEPAFKAIGDGLSDLVDDIGPLIDLVGDLTVEFAKLGETKVLPDLGPLDDFAPTIKQVNDFLKNTLFHLDDMKSAWADIESMWTVNLDAKTNVVGIGERIAQTTADAAAAADDLADAQKRVTSETKAAIDALGQLKTDLPRQLEEMGNVIEGVQLAVDDMAGSFNDMGRASDAIGAAFDLGNRPLEALGQITDINDGIRDLVHFIDDKDGLKGKIPNIFNPNDVNAGPFLAKIDSLRGPIQQAVTDAFATGGPAAAQATADSYVKQIVASMHGKLTPGDVQELLGLHDLTATLKVAVDQKSLAEAQGLIELVAGIPGADPIWVANVKLALQAGDLTSNAVKLLLADKAGELGVNIPPKLLAMDPKEVSAAKAQADRFAADPKNAVGMKSTVASPDKTQVGKAHDDGQAIAATLPITFPSTVASPTVRRFDSGGTVDGGGGIAGERGPEILNRRYLTEGPTFVPPGTRVTSRRRTAVILRQSSARRLRRYDSGGTVPSGPVTVNFNNVGSIGNRYDLMRTIHRANLDKIRLRGTRG